MCLFLKHLADIAKKGNGEGIRLRGFGNLRGLEIDNLDALVITDLKEVLRSVEERSSVETLSQLEQMKLFFWSSRYLHSGEKCRYITRKSRCLSVKKFSLSCTRYKI